jgi:hypothetical protein
MVLVVFYRNHKKMPFSLRLGTKCLGHFGKLGQKNLATMVTCRTDAGMMHGGKIFVDIQVRLGQPLGKPFLPNLRKCHYTC